jgi:hypothetical protein
MLNLSDREAEKRRVLGRMKYTSWSWAVAGGGSEAKAHMWWTGEEWKLVILQSHVRPQDVEAFVQWIEDITKLFAEGTAVD